MSSKKMRIVLLSMLAILGLAIGGYAIVDHKKTQEEESSAAEISALKLFKYLFVRKMAVSGIQFAVLVTAMVVAYVVSIFVIRFLMSYIKRHDFSSFGVYRIILGLVVIIVFGLLL